VRPRPGGRGARAWEASCCRSDPPDPSLPPFCHHSHIILTPFLHHSYTMLRLPLEWLPLSSLSRSAANYHEVPNTHTHTHTRARTHARTHTHTYAHTHIRAHTHTHTHIHTHTKRCCGAIPPRGCRLRLWITHNIKKTTHNRQHTTTNRRPSALVQSIFDIISNYIISNYIISNYIINISNYIISNYIISNYRCCGAVYSRGRRLCLWIQEWPRGTEARLRARRDGSAVILLYKKER
jgi:hypothetical protein